MEDKGFMKRSCLIVTGGKIDEDFARSFLEKESFQKIIAVDGGLEAAERLGLIPDYVVGDFDTVRSDVLERFRQVPFIVWEQHKPEKNETDTELARSCALTLGLQPDCVFRCYRRQNRSHAGQSACALCLSAERSRGLDCGPPE